LKRIRRHAAIESVEPRVLMAVTSITVLPIAPTEGVPFGTTSSPVPVAQFTVDNYIGIDESSEYSADIKWGDGTVSGGLAGPTIQFFQNLGNGAASYQILGFHTYTDATPSSNPINLTVDVFDNTGPGTTQTGSTPISVIDQMLTQSALPSIHATVGVPLTNVDVADFVDGNLYAKASDLQASVQFSNPSESVPGVVVQDASGVFHVLANHTYDATSGGTSPVQVTIKDEVSSLVMSNTATVSNAAATLTLTTTAAPASATEGSSQVFTLGTFTSSNAAATAGNFNVTVDWGEGSPLSPGTITGPVGGVFTITGTHTYANETTTPATITLRLVDNTGGSAGATTTATVADAKLTAGLSSPIFATEHQPLNQVPVATFTDANPLATAADFAATIDWGDSSSSSGTVALVGGSAAGAVFAVYGSHVYNSGGPFSTQVVVTDVGGSTTTITGAGNVTVSESPIVVDAEALTSTAGVAIPTGTVVATFVDNASTDPVTNYTPVTINWGDGHTDTLTGGAGIVSLGGGQFQVATTVAHTYAASGAYALTVTVNDLDPASGTGSNLVFVAPATLTVTPTAAPASATEGSSQVFTLGTFTSSSPAAASDFNVTIDWGDGSPQSAGVITGPVSGVFTIKGTHTYTEETTAPDTITLSLSDNTGGSAVATTTATVADAKLASPAGIAGFGTIGQSLTNIPLGTFADDNPLATAADYSVSINWGAGALTPTTLGFATLVGGNGTQSFFSVSGSVVYTTPGVHPVSITVTDVGGQSTTINTSVTVTSSAVSATVLPLTGVEGNPTTPGVIATFTVGNGTEPASNFFVTLNWGDGQTIDTTSGLTVINEGNGSYSITAPAHTYAEEGVFVITVTITDSTAPSPVTAANIATIKDAPLTGTNGSPQSVVQGNSVLISPLVTFTDANPGAPLSDFTATIDWGDGTSSRGTITKPNPAVSSFAVSGTHTFQKPGTYTATVFIQDVGGSTTTASATIVVSAQTITFGSEVKISGYDNTPLTHVDVATFTSNDPIATAVGYVATIDWGDGTPVTAGTIVEDAAGVFHVEGSHTYTQAGTFFPTITIAANDPTILGQTKAMVTIAANPLLVVAAPIAATEGIALPAGTVVATFTDSVQSDPISAFTATIAFGNGVTDSSAMIVSTGGGNFEVESSVPVTYVEEGSYAVTVSVTDHNANDPTGFLTANARGTAAVGDAPLTGSLVQPTITGVQQQPLSQAPPVLGVPASAGAAVAEFTDGNPAAPLSDFSATIDWGDGTPQSAGQIFQPGGIGTPFFVFGNHVYAQPSSSGVPYVVTVTIHDTGGSHLTTLTTAAVSASTITGTGVTFSGVEAQPLSNVVVAYFTDSSTPGPISGYSATINWGDSSTPPTTLGQIVGLGGNDFEVLGNHTYAEENSPTTTPYSVTVTINHNGALATVVSSHANIADAPIGGVAIPVFATEGATFTSTTVAIFTDSNPGAPLTDYPASNLVIDWGDGSTPSFGTISQPGGTGTAFYVAGSHTYAEDGSHVFSVKVTDVGGSTFTAFGTATVADAPLSSTGLNSTLPEGPLPASPLPGTVIPSFNVATFTDAGNNTSIPNDIATPANYVATINWGDGVVTTGTISDPVISGGVPTYTVSGQHLYADEGTFSTTITIKDVGGATITTTGVITITDAALTAGTPAAAPLTVVEGNAFTLPVANFNDANLAGAIADFAATITWGDGSTSAGIIAQESTPAGSPTQFTVTGTHTYADETPAGTPYAISVAIKDDGGSAVTITNTATVIDAPLSSEGATIVGTEGTPLSPGTVGNGLLVATVQDSNPAATVADFTSVASGGAGGSVTLDWGDGSPLVTLPATNIVAIGTASGVTFEIFGGPHVYAEEGSYKITVTAHDDGGAATVASSVANIADAALSPAAAQPVIGPQTGGVSFTTPVATFLDANPNASVSDFTATIDWGDGTPRSTGTITSAGPNVTIGGVTYSQWTVTGSHNYVDPFVNGGSGKFPITVTVDDDGGASTVVTNSATVNPIPLTLTGALSPSSDTGKFHTDGITRINQPRFTGTAEQYATVQLFAAPAGTSNYSQVGLTEADSSGAWSITTSALADGSYSILAKETNRSGVGTMSIQIMPSATQGPLVIDTVGPRITSATFDRFDSTATFTFQDVGAGLLTQSLEDAANYSLKQIFKAHGNIALRPLVVTSITVTPGSTADSDNVTVVFNHGKYLVGGLFQISVVSASSTASGVQDLAGNALDGEFYGPNSATGNGVPGGNFVADFAIFHRFNSGPLTIIGFPHPNDPPANFPTGTRKHATKPHSLEAKATRPFHISKPGLDSLAAALRGLDPGVIQAINPLPPSPR
jgi:hypothetical protein